MAYHHRDVIAFIAARHAEASTAARTAFDAHVAGIVADVQAQIDELDRPEPTRATTDDEGTSDIDRALASLVGPYGTAVASPSHGAVPAPPLPVEGCRGNRVGKRRWDLRFPPLTAGRDQQTIRSLVGVPAV